MAVYDKYKLYMMLLVLAVEGMTWFKVVILDECVRRVRLQITGRFWRVGQLRFISRAT